MQSSVGLKPDAAIFQERVAVAVFTRSPLSDNSDFMNSGCSMVGFRTPTTSCFLHIPTVLCVGTLFLQNYVCSQKLASDIIHVAADGEFLTNYKSTELAPLLRKKWTAAVFCLGYSYSSCCSK
jgi:hypothetical protein